MNREINFKSTPINYRKECLNIKPNTIRRFDNSADIRKEILDKFIDGFYTNLTICITNVQSREQFVRRVKDVTLFENIYIISWFEMVRVI